MRLIRCRLESVRRHRALELSFAPGLTLVGGSNESGKSSLVEAMHRALFVKATATGAAIRDLRSLTHAGHPLVELDFESKGHCWSLQKCFRGAGGTSRLSRTGQAALLGADAEDHLATLLGVDETIGSRQANRILPTRWSHLWVMQGLAGRNLLALDAEYYDLNGLIAALETQAEESLQSPLDQHVYEQLESLVAASLTSRGVKQNSDLWKRRQELKQAIEARNEAQERLTAYEHACRDLDGNEQALSDLEHQAPELQRLRDQHTALKDLQQRLAPLRLQQQQWAQELSGLTGLTKAIKTAEIAMVEARRELESQVQSSQDRIQDLKSQQTKLDQQDCQRQRLEERGQSLRRRQDQQRLCASINQIQRRREQQLKLEKQQVELRRALQRMPGGDAKALSDLQAQHRQLRELEIRLQSMASRIEVLSSDLVVTVDGESIVTGEVLQRAGAFRIAVGDDVEIAVSPGEGTGCSELIAEQERARTQLQAALTLWGVDSVEAAEAQFRSREHQQQALSLTDARLRQLVEQDGSAEGSEALEKLQAQLDALQQQDAELEPEDMAGEIVDLDQALAECRQQYRAVQELLRSLKQRLDQSDQAHQRNERQLQEHRLQLERLRVEHRQKMDQKQAIEERLGSPDQIRTRLEAVTQECDQLQQRLHQLCEASGLAGGLDASQALIALDEQEQRLNRQLADLNRERGALLERCERLGNRELHAELEEAIQRQEVAVQAEKQETQLVDARVMLLKRFQSARSDLSQRYSAPLSTSIDGFLAPLLQKSGDRSELRFDAKEGFSDLRLQRSGQSMDFAQLSGGLKEQLNAAVRMAMAHTLSEAHDGCLPLLFDDAFTNTDPVRLKVVKSMLRQAVDLGLQVVVLSCDPDPYVEIADHVVSL
ncbi:AAA family ATPase [Synechococcus sp. NOUM97013]|uniref:AAA family ATPase n=1 Tax=Synechococcus sp. NOUM97013 TaxID=1442555 RepID=UPI001644A737|nr:AAA family ATPase [Synechococcus sp. NOUM97013]QNI73385.1 AAA domain protein [Synechococcus sp. NOUM97013]